jgi:hypothetical protein
MRQRGINIGKQTEDQGRRANRGTKIETVIYNTGNKTETYRDNAGNKQNRDRKV